jgi:hypothetical protein
VHAALGEHLGRPGTERVLHLGDQGQQRALVRRTVGESRGDDQLRSSVHRDLPAVALVEARRRLHDPALGIREVLLSRVGRHAKVPRERLAAAALATGLRPASLCAVRGGLARFESRLRRRDRRQPGLPRDLHPLHEHGFEGRQVPLPKLGEGAVRRDIARREQPIRDVLLERPRNPPRGEGLGGIRIQQHRDHHLRVEWPVTPTVPFIRRVERGQAQRRHRVRDEERRMALGAPVPRRRGRQRGLIGRARTKGRRHAPANTAAVRQTFLARRLLAQTNPSKRAGRNARRP